MRRRRNVEIIAGRVNSDGSIAAGEGFGVNKFATGGYTITFAPGFRLLALQVTPYSAGNVYLGHSNAYTERGSTVTLFTTAGAGIDFPWTFVAVGW
jgi:hypothetical protein